MFIFQLAHAPTPHPVEPAHTTPPVQTTPAHQTPAQIAATQQAAYNETRAGLVRTGMSPWTQTINCTAQIEQQRGAVGRALGNNPQAQTALANYHPVGVVVPEAEILRRMPAEERQQFAHHGQVNGYTLRNGTILIRAGQSPAQQTEVMRHEMLHGVAENLRHNQITYEGHNNAQIPHAALEAAVQYTTATSMPANTHTPMAYPAHVATMALLEHQVGRPALQQAITTGNFTQVQHTVDEHLGAGTFQTAMGHLEHNDPARAYNTLYMPMHNINPRGVETFINTNPVMVRCNNTISEQQAAQRLANTPTPATVPVIVPATRRT